MKILQSHTLRLSLFTLILLFTIYGCNTTNNATTTKTPDAKPGKPQSSPAEHHEEAVADKKSESDKRQAIEKLHKRLSGFIAGHGGGTENTRVGENTTSTKKSTENLEPKPEEIANRPFIELEKKLYGNWINKKETESYEFLDDGTVLINVIGERGRSRTLNGNYILVEKDRIKIDFRGESFARQMPPRYFKISISADKFTLTDEPKSPDGPDGPSTNYNRVN